MRAEVGKLGMPSLAFDPAGACGAECTSCCVGRNVSSAGPGSSNASTAYPSTNYTGVLAQHNAYRAKHSAPPLVWNESLAAAADAYAAKCFWAHDPNRVDMGENLLYGAAADASLAKATDDWYNEIKDVSHARRI